MANVDRRWLAPILIVLAVAASIAVYAQLPPVVALRLEGVLPFTVTESARPGSRALVFLVPAITMLVWAAFRAAPTALGQRVGRSMLPRAPEEVTSPAQFERFSGTYETIVLAVVVLLTGVQAAILAALLQHAAIASRLIPIVLGASLIFIGNVMPRLRANWVAGLRTQRTFEDPQLWRTAHRAFGTALVVSGILTIIVAVSAPEYGLVTGIATLLVSCVVGFVASTRRGGVAHAAALIAGISQLL